MSLSQPPFQSAINNDQNLVTTAWQQWLQRVQIILNGSSQSGPTSNRPTNNLYVGQPFFDTTLNKPVYWNGSTWVHW